MEKGEKVRVLRDAENYRAADCEGEIFRVKADGSYAVKLTKSDDIVACKITEVEPLEASAWANITEWLDEEGMMPGTYASDPMLCGGRALFGYDYTTADETDNDEAPWEDAWEDLDEGEQQEWIAQFTAGMDAWSVASGRMTGASREEIEQVRHHIRQAACMSLTGEKLEGSDDEEATG